MVEKDHFELAKSLIPWASQTRSKSYKRFPDNYPKFADEAHGCYVTCGGKRYLDFISSLGPIILGYRDQIVDYFVVYQIANFGNLFSLPSILEAEVASELNRIIPCADMVCFLKNGGDATMAAVKLARICTGKSIVLNRGYHGWSVFDQLKPWTDFEDSFNKNDIIHWDDLAAILVEPELFSKEDLASIRNYCNKNSVVLIFDEVITGFRIRMGGMQEYYGVIPDLACFSKAMANGYPIAALVGKRDLMKRLEDDVFVSTTFGGDMVGLAAALATIKRMKFVNCIDHLWSVGSYLLKGLKSLIEEYDFPMTLHGFPPMIHFKMPNDLHSVFLQETIKRGIMIYNSHNLNFCHNNGEIDFLLDVYKEIFPLIKDGKVKLEGESVKNTQLFRQWR